MAFLAITPLIIFSCKDVYNDLNPNNTSLSSQRVSATDDPMKYAQENLKMIGLGVLKSSNNEDFRNMVYSEIGKKFDGDNNVLIKTIEEKAQQLNISIVESIAQGMNDNSLVKAKESMNAFKNIDSKEYFPQVYIPFFDALKKEGKIGKTSPTIIIFNGDEKEANKNGLLGYMIDKKGKILTLQSIKENYAKQNEVWIISINERTVGTPQGIKLKGGRLADSKDINSSSKVASVNAWEWQMSEIKVLVDKDSGWLMGESEVCMKAVVDFLPVNGVSANYLYSSGYLFLAGLCKDEQKIANVGIVRTHKSTNNFKWSDIIGNDAYNGSKYMYYVIYEDDNWPVGNRVASFDRVGGGIIQIEYRSADDYYSTDILLGSKGPLYANGVSVFGITFYGRYISNSEIEYHIEVKP
jgi:hypothetical protein